MLLVSKSIRIVPSSPDRERKAQATLAHVTKGWIPPNPATFEKIHLDVHSGRYDYDRTPLVEEVKSDLSVLTHVAKFLRNRLEEPTPSIHPLRDLHAVSEEDLRAMFACTPGKISKHRITGSTRIKSEILQTTLAASSAAQLIATKASESDLPVSSETAYVSTAFRNLGWNLIAWNYPDLTSSALRVARGDRKAAGAYLKNVLGYSPEELSEKASSAMLLQPEIRDAIALGTPGRQLVTASIESRLLATVSDLGESFTRVNRPGASESDRKDWQQRSKELVALAPGLDVEELAAEVHETAGRAAVQWGSVTSRATRAPREEETPAQKAPKRSFDANRYLQKCPETIKAEFKPVYEEIRGDGASVDALQSLVGKAIPAAGFSGGCIYLMHNLKPNLIPAVRLGTAPTGRNKKLQSLLEASAMEAFNSDVPMRKQEMTEDGLVMEHVCAAFGDAERPGVLVLEVSREVAGDPEYDSALMFKAVRQCLHDCLAMTA